MIGRKNISPENQFFTIVSKLDMNGINIIKHIMITIICLQESFKDINLIFSIQI